MYATQQPGLGFAPLLVAIGMGVGLAGKYIWDWERAGIDLKNLPAPPAPPAPRAIPDATAYGGFRQESPQELQVRYRTGMQDFFGQVAEATADPEPKVDTTDWLLLGGILAGIVIVSSR